jgi:hypothetical protein
MLRIAVLTAVLGGTLAAGTAYAQGVFGDSPPRPPGSIPNGLPPQPPPVQYPSQSPLSPPSAGPPPSGIQAQPLPPPPGATVAPAPQRARAAPPAPAPSGAPQPQPPSQPQTAAVPPPDDTIVTEPPAQKIENGRAVFSGLDKITGRIISFDSAIGETVQFGALQVTARVCYTRPPTEATNTDAFVEVDEVTLQGEVKRIFNGWMFAASPGLHGVEHPIYDVWLTDCASPAPAKVAEPAPPPATTPTRPVTPARQRQAQPQRQQMTISPGGTTPPAAPAPAGPPPAQGQPR